MTGHKTNTAVIMFGAVAALGGLALVWSGLTALSQERDEDGFLMSNPLTIESSSRAVNTTDPGLLRGHYECAGEESLLLGFRSPDDVRMQGVASGPGALFMGIAPAGTVEAYLNGVAHDEITEWDCNVDDIVGVEYTRQPGTAAVVEPATEPWWVASTSGTGQQTLDWTIESGDWAVVIMNADASNGVSADLRFGALAPSSLEPLAWSSFAAGVIALVGGGLLLYFGLRRPREDSASATVELG